MAEETTSEMDNTQEVTETVTTPVQKTEEFDKARAMATIEKLRSFEKEAEKLRKQVAAHEQAEKTRKEAEMTDLQKAQARLAELEAALTAKELAERKRTIAEKVGLPPTLAARLQGASDEELEQDAKALLESLPKPANKPSGINPTNPANATQGETLAQQKMRIFGGNVDIFDPNFAKAHGGGFFHDSKE